MELLDLEVSHDSREHIEIVVSGYCDDWDVGFVEPNCTVFERPVGLEVPILAVGNITSDYDCVDVAIDSFLDCFPPDCRWRKFVSIQILRNSCRMTAQMEVAGTENR